MIKLTVNYEIQDIFKQSQFISTTAWYNSMENLKTAFKAIKKYNATIFIFYNATTATRYERTCSGDDTVLLKTPLTFINGVQNEDKSILVEYSTALKQELKRFKKDHIIEESD